MIAKDRTLYDGQIYQKGEEIWDLGSFVATKANGNQRYYKGLSKDVGKLPNYVETGSTALCIDNGEKYMYEKSTGKWYLLASTGSGGHDGFDYRMAVNKPSINGVTLEGDKTFEELGIMSSMENVIIQGVL